MSGRLRIILPLANVLVAGLLLFLGLFRLRQLGAPAESPEILLCQWINVPASLLHNLIMFVWSKVIVANLALSTFQKIDYTVRILDVGVFLALVFATWYIVGLEIESGVHGKRAIVPSAKAGRIFVDGLIILVGLVIGLGEVADWSRSYFSAWVMLRALLHLGWALVLITVYGHDLVKSAVKTSMKT